MKFNINNYVRVKLNDYGRQILLEQFLERRAIRPDVFREFNLLQEDNEGWSKWQMWNFMNTFGEYVHLGAELPFEAEIEIVDQGHTK